MRQALVFALVDDYLVVILYALLFLQMHNYSLMALVVPIFVLLQAQPKHLQLANDVENDSNDDFELLAMVSMALQDPLGSFLN